MIEIIKGGIYSTVQDLGRSGVSHLGIPISGAMDRRAAIYANRLLNNDDSTALIECTTVGPELRFLSETAIAITGAVVQPFINDQAVNMYENICVRSGDNLRFGRIVSGARYYIAVAGGLATPQIHSSQSACITSGISSLLRAGDRLMIGEHLAVKSSIPTLEQLKNKIVTAYKGPEYGMIIRFQDQILNKLSATLLVLPHSNRMAVRVSHDSDLSHQLSIISSATIPGTVQLTPAGQLIFLMRDCQTTGGYPRILQLTERSICQLAQLKAGDRFSIEII